MFRLILDIFRGSGFLFFLFLQAIGLLLVFSFNQNQQAIGLNTIKTATDAGADFYSFVLGFKRAKSQLDSLRYENARLRSELASAKYEDRYELDTAVSVAIQQFTYTPAKVVKNSINLNNNTITIDRGSRHGLTQNMGVIDATGNGLVGIVRNVTPYYSDVISLLHRESRISVELGETGAVGSLVWRGMDPQRLQLITIPLYVPVERGTPVRTSGYSSMFPQGLEIGVVEEVAREPGSNYHEITVKLNNDMSSLRYVDVVRNLLREHLPEIEE